MMIGQGRPNRAAAHAPPNPNCGRPREKCAPPVKLNGMLRGWSVAFIGIIFFSLVATAAAEPTVQLRIAWGEGNRARQWQGTVSIDRGKLEFVRALGREADEPGSIWLDANRIEIHERSPRFDDGLDLQATAPLDALLKVEFRDANDPSAAPVVAEIALSELMVKPSSKDLDKSGNHLLIRRAPGDMLRIDLKRDQLVFSPGDTLQFDVQPRMLPVAAGSTVQLQARLVAKAGGKEWSTQEQTVKTTAEDSIPASVPWQFKLPPVEGVYDVVIEALEPATLLRPRSKLLAERHVQLVVVAEQSLPAPADANAAWTPVMEIDPANPHWYDRFKSWSLLPNLSQGTLSNGPLQTAPHTLGSVVQLPPNVPVPIANGGPGGGASDLHWAAYPLTIGRIGAPHILEVEYPSDVQQSLGISILEPNAADMVLPIELDSGFFVEGDEVSSGPATWQKHRLLFWPRTNKAILLLTNRSGTLKAAYGKIRVLAGPSKLPRAFPASDTPERLWAGYQSRPLVPQNFGATEAYDPLSQRSLSDWQTFYEGASRLAEYLNYVGYSGEMLTVMADGSTIYPSKLLEPATRYDSGAFFDLANDPVRKDGLELILRLFDREGLKLVPALQFVAPLPELEARLRRAGDDAVGIQLIGPDGTTYVEKNQPQLGVAPYYNPLNQCVQDAMLSVVRELVQRYNQHPSFAGLSIELSADGYTQLPGDLWGLDDDTIGRFQRDTGVQVPGEGEKRFLQRAAFFAEPQRDEAPKPQREAWLKWRATVLAEFYRRIQKELTSTRRDAVLYLAATNLFQGSDARRLLRPALPAKERIDEALSILGIRPELLRDQRGLVLLRPSQVLPPGPPALHGTDQELNRSADLDAQFRSATSTGLLFVNEPQTARLQSFDAKSPFGKDKTFTQLVAELSPSDRRNRQRFVHALAVSDPDTIFDGGWLLPMGQEDALSDLVATYRRLPAGKFATVPQPSEPVTIRTLSTQDRTYVYFVNDSQWPVTVQVNVDLPPGSRTEEISGRRQLPVLSGNQWNLTLKPFDLIAVRFWSPNVQIKKPEVTLDPRVKPLLSWQLQELRRRMATLVAPPPMSLLANPSFELPAKAGQIPGWTLLNSAAGSATVDVEGAAPPGANKPVGKQAARLDSTGAGVALVSDPLPAPTTGRLSVSVWLRVENAAQQPKVIMAINGLHNDKPYHPNALIGQGTTTCLIKEGWSQFVMPLDDVPTSGLDKLRVEFQLVGPGRVWIDDVQLFDLRFTQPEILQLGTILARADAQLDRGEYGQCLHELDAYWPRFLSTYVPLSQPAVANQQQQPPAAGNSPQPPKPPDQSAARSNNPLDWLKSRKN